MPRGSSQYRTPIASVTTAKGQTKQISFKDGIATYKDNDDLKDSELLAATDSRFVKIGRYKTRRGSDRYSVPIGEAINVQETSTTGAAGGSVSSTLAVAFKGTAGSTARVTRADVRIKKVDGATGTVLVELRSDDSGEPGDLLARSSIRAADITTSYAYLPVYFMEAPEITSGTAYWVVVTGQESVTGTYNVSSTTTTTTGKSSSDNGVSWSAANANYNVKLYTSTDGGVKGLFRAYRPNGTKLTVFAHGTSVYSVNDGTGATTAIKTGLNASATAYRFQMVQDALYFVNGYDKPYVYDFTTASEITASPYVSSLILEHKGLLFYVDTTDKTRLYYTNFADYSTFTSTDFIYVPAPKSYDSLTALAKLNGVLFMFANRNKFQLFGSDNATFSLDESAGQKGTFSQESVVYDQNLIYFASDDGIYKFDGTSEVNIALPILEDYLALTAKANCVLELFQNRLYVHYTPVGGADNTECFVYNTLLEKWESYDTGTVIGRTFSRYAQDEIFIQGSNRVGALYWGELATNDYHNLGDQLQWELRTAYSHFDAPGQGKYIPKWRPVFSSAGASYNVQCGYAFDLGDDVTYQDVSLSGSGATFDDGYTFDSGVTFAGQSNIEPTNLYIPGAHKRIQRRYRHIAAREPVEFDSEILSVQTQRLI